MRNPAAIDYNELVRMKQSILKNIYQNTVLQSEAFDKGDYDRLTKLLAERHNWIERLGQVRRCFQDYDDLEKDEVKEKLEQSTLLLVRRIIAISRKNVMQAERRRKDLGRVLRNIRLGRHAIRNGYFKKMPQRHGCFFDEKVGK